ncbi:MAG: hypothetical protein EOO59_19915, partial [Hymenobacter sp.]
MRVALARWFPSVSAQRFLVPVGLLLVLLGAVAARTAARKSLKSNAVYTVTATAYEAVASQTDSKPFVTADNSRIPRGYGSHTRWLALSRDLLRPWGGPFDFGDKVRVEGISAALDGVYTVHDTMNRRYRHRLDVLAHPREHLSLAQTGVRLRRLSAAHQASSQRPSRAKTTAAAVAHRRHKNPTPTKRHAAPLKQNKQLATKPVRPAQRPVSLAHQKHGVAKKQLAALPKRPKKRVVAQVHHLAPAQVLR